MIAWTEVLMSRDFGYYPEIGLFGRTPITWALSTSQSPRSEPSCELARPGPASHLEHKSVRSTLVDPTSAVEILESEFDEGSIWIAHQQLPIGTNLIDVVIGPAG